MPLHDAALRRFRPRLLYDSNEAFFADSAREWTDNPGNILRRTRADGRPGDILAAATPTKGEQRLELAFLGAETYADGRAVEETDAICSPHDDYREMYVALRQRPGYANAMYGRAKEDGAGQLWLQYWFFYFFNDYQLAGGFGLHEGDWEMIQLRMAGDEPDLAVFAQHRCAEQSAWEDVLKDPAEPDRPLVYVARGSHAAYFGPGLHVTEIWLDIADGERPAPELTLEIVSDPPPDWLRWPGRWGDTRARVRGLEQPSPHGPAHHHDQWDDPAALLQDVRSHVAEDLPGEPRVTAGREHGRLVVELEADAHGEGALEKLIVTINSPDDRLPPRTSTFALTGVVHATLETAIELVPEHRYDIRISATDVDGRPLGSKLLLLAPDDGKLSLDPAALPRMGLTAIIGALKHARRALPTERTG